MIQKILLIIVGILAGGVLGYFLVTGGKIPSNFNIQDISQLPKKPQKQVIGFLPFWLIDKARSDYSGYITTLNYFDLTIDTDGSIVKFTNPGESDPGWHALTTGKVDGYLANAKQKGMKLSLTVFNGNGDKIQKLLNDPVVNAQNLVNASVPIMQQYGFTDLNLDVEQAADASPEARLNFSKFVSEIKKGLVAKNAGTLTIDISPIAFVKDTNIVDPKSVTPYVDYVILMAYDYHNPGSLVTGPVSPQTGAGTISEFDTESAVEKALTIVPNKKLILGIPLYGYSWETINPRPRSATIPSTFVTMSNVSAETFLTNCTNCTTNFDDVDKEQQIVYKDQKTGTYHQIFYPVEKSTQAKVDFTNAKNLGGIAVWAIGYEGTTILNPLKGYLAK